MTLVRQKSVGWYDPGQLINTAQLVIVSSLFGRNADHRLIEAVSSGTARVDDYANRPTPFWLDYVSDSGDGWDATYAVAYTLAQPTLPVPGAPGGVTQRGSILVFGGDEIYPTPSKEAYDNRLLYPYATALPLGSPGPMPDVFAIPGNHDWYDSLVAFTRVFCSKDKFAGWNAPQERSYFALKLPRGWWLLGTDLQLGSDIDGPQRDFFAWVEKQMIATDRIILCHAEPHWIYETIYPPESGARTYEAVRKLEEILRPERIAVYVAGDLHHYRHHALGNVHKITAGGGGAFLHLTNGQRVSTLADGSKLKAEYPTRRTSNALCLKNLFFPYFNPWFGVATAMLYLLSAWVVMGPQIGNPAPLATAVEAVALRLLYDSFAAFWIVAVFSAFMVFTDTHSKTYRYLASPLHGAAQLGALFFTTWGASTLASAVLPPGSDWRLPLTIGLLLPAAYLAGSLIMGVYLLISLNVFGRHQNEASSSLRSPDWKNFLRLCIDEKGTLTIYPLGIRKVARNWVSAGGPGPSTMAPARPMAVTLIEPPITVRKP